MLTSMPASRLELVFRGRVQGVGFRARAGAAAARFGVLGWVRNEPDGSVRCVAEAEEAVTKEFLNNLLTTMSRYVDSHEAISGHPSGEFSAFTVRS
ncbi:MAG: acylphosphatase [Planctomycetota bacterium]